MDNDIPQSSNMKLPAPVESDATPSEHQTGAIPMPVNPAAVQQVASSPQANTSDAADTDEIEDHWIQLVETMVRGGVNDPRSLAQRFSELKAQYIRSRYGIEVRQAVGREGQHDTAP